MELNFLVCFTFKSVLKEPICVTPVNDVKEVVIHLWNVFLTTLSKYINNNSISNFKATLTTQFKCFNKPTHQLDKYFDGKTFIFVWTVHAFLHFSSIFQAPRRYGRRTAIELFTNLVRISIISRKWNKKSIYYFKGLFFLVKWVTGRL